MEMSGQLRTVRATLFSDLANATCRALPWQRPDEDPGYLEIVEGGRSDKEPTVLALDLATSQVPGSQVTPAGDMTDRMGLGDYDDILALTVRSELSPFKGRYRNAAGIQETIESDVAEVIWFAVENPAVVGVDEPGMRKVYRRVLLVAPWVDLSGFAAPTANNASNYKAFYDVCDVSVRIEQTSTGLAWVPNTLGDLTKRENRFGHFYNFDTTIAAGYPHYFPHDWAATPSPVNAGPASSVAPFTGDREGEDLMLDNVLAFDLLVFDPRAPLFQYQNAIIEPVSGSPFTEAVRLGNLVGFGAYVDLGWDNGSSAGPDVPDYNYAAFTDASQPHFQQERQLVWHPSAPNAFRGPPAVYDTWSLHYEHDGIDQDPGNANPALSNIVDQGANGLDDDGINGVDDILERETSPPYLAPLRGMQVKLRIYEPNTRQIRQATVTSSFVP